MRTSLFASLLLAASLLVTKSAYSQCTITGRLVSGDIHGDNTHLFGTAQPGCTYATTPAHAFEHGTSPGSLNDLHTIKNTTGSSQCVTFTLSHPNPGGSSNNITFFVFKNGFPRLTGTLNEVVGDYLDNILLAPAGATIAEVTTGSGAGYAPVTGTVTIADGQTVYILVSKTDNSGDMTTDYSLQVSNLSCNACTVIHNNVFATPANFCTGSSATTTITATANGGVFLGAPTIISSGTINLAIPDDNSVGVNTSINVPAAALANASELQVRLNIGHSFAGDLKFTLTSPCGTTVLLDRPGVPQSSLGNNNNFGTSNVSPNTPPAVYTFDISALDVIPEISEPAGFIPAGHYRPSDVNGSPHNYAGLAFPCAAAGVWTLNVSDNVDQDFGVLADWAIIISPSTGVYTHTLTGPGTIVQNAPTGIKNENASFTVTNIPAGTTSYSLTSNDPSGCSKTTQVNITDASITHTDVVASPSSFCAGGSTTITGTAANGLGSLPITTSSGTVNLVIPDGNPVGINSTINLPATAIADANSLKIRVNIKHSFIGDLKFTLTSPCGTSVILDRPGFPVLSLGNSNNFGGDNTSSPPPAVYIFDLSAADVVSETVLPSGYIPAGSYHPSDASGQPHNYSGFTFPCGGAGVWTLTVSDATTVDVGTLVDWAIITNPDYNYTHTLTGPGTITANPSSGSHNSNASFTVTNIPAGNHAYTLTSFDPSGCSTSTTVNLAQAQIVHSNIISTPSAVCAGGSTVITATASGGVLAGIPVITSSGTINLAIPDGVSAGVNSTINVPAVTLANAGSLKVRLNISHTYVGDLKFTLTSPCGQTILLDRPGFPLTSLGNGNNLGMNNAGSNTPPGVYTFDVTAAGVIPEAALPSGFIPQGYYRPSDANGTAHDYTGFSFPCAGAGVWTLNIADNTTVDVGTLIDWSLIAIPSGNYTHQLTGPGTIVQNAPSGPGNSNAGFTVSNIPAGNQSYTLTTTDPNGCSTSTPIAISAALLTHSNLLATPPAICVGGSSVITATVNGGNVSATTNTVSSGTINLSIPDNAPAGVNNSINLPATSLENASSLKVRLNISHTFAGDLKFTLTSPCGNTILLDRPGVPLSSFGNGDNLGTTNAASGPPPAVYTFDIAAATIIPETANGNGFIPAGNYRPSDAGGAAHNYNGLAFPCAAAGVWTLNISDNGGGDFGSLVDWAILTTTGTNYTHTLTGPGTIVQNASSGANNSNASFNVSNLAVGNNAFTLTSTDPTGCTVSSPVSVVVNPVPDAVATPSSQSSCSGAAITPILLTGSVSGTSFTWTRNNTATVTGIPANGAGNISGVLTNTTSAPITVTFTITPSANGCNGPSITATVTVNPLPVISCPANITTAAVIGTCAAVATYTPTIMGIPAPTVSYTFSGATTGAGAGSGSGSSFNVGVTTVTVTATNSCATVSCSFTVTVTDSQLPVVTTQPVNVSVCEGLTATFTAAGTNVLSYQWQQFNGSTFVNIPGATGPTLTLNNVAFAQNNSSYRAQLTGLCSTIFSNAATLRVFPAATVSILAAPASILPNQTATLTAVTNNGPGSFVWTFNGAIIPGETGPNLGPLYASAAGTYRVAYTDLNGCKANSADQVLTAIASDLVLVYPNPNLGDFHVRYYNQANEKATVNVYNPLGQRVYSKEFVTAAPYTQLDISLGLKASGIYTVEIVDGSGKIRGAKRIMVNIK